MHYTHSGTTSLLPNLMFNMLPLVSRVTLEEVVSEDEQFTK